MKTAYQGSGVAQLVERLHHNLKVAGSILTDANLCLPPDLTVAGHSPSATVKNLRMSLPNCCNHQKYDAGMIQTWEEFMGRLCFQNCLPISQEKIIISAPKCPKLWDKSLATGKI